MSTNRTTAKNLDHRLITLIEQDVIANWSRTLNQWAVTRNDNTEVYGFAEIKAFVDGAIAMNERYQIALEGVMEGLS